MDATDLHDLPIAAFSSDSPAPGLFVVCTAEDRATCDEYARLFACLEASGAKTILVTSLAAAEAAMALKPDGMPGVALVAMNLLPKSAQVGPLLNKISFIAVSSDDRAATVKQAFALGALDFFRQPLSLDEAVVKLQRHAGRQNAPERRAAPPQADLSSLSLNATALTVGWESGQKVALTPREHQIFSLIFHAAGHSATRPAIFSNVWSAVKVCQKVLDVHVSKLRKKLKPLGLEVNFVRPNNYRLEPADYSAQPQSAAFAAMAEATVPGF